MAESNPSPKEIPEQEPQDNSRPQEEISEEEEHQADTQGGADDARETCTPIRDYYRPLQPTLYQEISRQHELAQRSIFPMPYLLTFHRPGIPSSETWRTQTRPKPTAVLLPRPRTPMFDHTAPQGPPGEDPPPPRRHRPNPGRQLQLDDLESTVMPSTARARSPSPPSPPSREGETEEGEGEYVLLPVRERAEANRELALEGEGVPHDDIEEEEGAIALPTAGTRNQRRPIFRGVMFGGLIEVPFDPELDARPHACFNCRQVGHIQVRCPQPRRSDHCVNCGRKGVRVYNCPRCKDAYWEFRRAREHEHRQAMFYGEDPPESPAETWP